MDMLSISRFSVVTGVFLVLVTSKVPAGSFGFGKKQNVELFPMVFGQITLQGRPVEGVQVVREASYDDAEIQKTETGPDGRFSFPEWTIRSRTPGKAFVEDRIRQVLIAEYKDQEYLLWYYVTGRVRGEHVVAQKLGRLVCDLTDEEMDYHFPSLENPGFTHNVGSICRW